MARYDYNYSNLADPALLLNLLNNTRQIHIQPESRTTHLANSEVPWNETEQAILASMNFSIRATAFCNGGRGTGRVDLQQPQQVLLQVASGPVLSQGTDFTADFAAIGAKPLHMIHQELVAKASKQDSGAGGGDAAEEQEADDTDCMLKSRQAFAAQLHDESIQEKYKALIKERLYLVLQMVNADAAETGEKVTVTTAGLGLGLFIEGFDSAGENGISLAKTLYGQAITELLLQHADKLPQIDHVIFDPHTGVEEQATQRLGNGGTGIAYSVRVSGKQNAVATSTPIMPPANLAPIGEVSSGRAQRPVKRLCAVLVNGDLVSPPFTGNEYVSDYAQKASASHDTAVISSTDALQRVTGQRGSYDQVIRQNRQPGLGCFYPVADNGKAQNRDGWCAAILRGFGLSIPSVIITNAVTGKYMKQVFSSVSENLCLLEVEEDPALKKFKDVAKSAKQVGGGARAANGAGLGGGGAATGRLEPGTGETACKCVVM